MLGASGPPLLPLFDSLEAALDAPVLRASGLVGVRCDGVGRAAPRDAR